MEWGLEGCFRRTFFIEFPFAAELVGLLKWRLKPDDVLTALQSVLNVVAEELVKVSELFTKSFFKVADIY